MRSGARAAAITIEAGRKRIVRGFRKDRSDWEALILDHHEGYIGWAEFERNQRLIADNANGKSFMSRGSVRRGEALLAGLLRCGHCGRKLHVAYSGENGSSGRYHCRGGHLNHGGERCISFGGMRIDRALGAAPRSTPPWCRRTAGGGFLAHERNVVLVGGTGTGKSHLAIAIARACIRGGARGRFFNVVDLVNRLEAEGRAGRQGRMADYLSPDGLRRAG